MSPALAARINAGSGSYKSHPSPAGRRNYGPRAHPLLDVAASLDVTGHQVPETWAESATATVEDARSMVDGFMLPAGLEGFEDPAIHVEPGVAIVAFAGPGNRGFLLTQDVDGELAPPLEAKVRGVTVQGNEGRYTPERGLLEWVDGDLTVSLTSTTLSLEELIVIAGSLREH